MFFNAYATIYAKSLGSLPLAGAHVAYCGPDLETIEQFLPLQELAMLSLSPLLTMLINGSCIRRDAQLLLPKHFLGLTVNVMTDQQTLSTDQVWNNFTIQLRRFIASRVRNDSDVEDILQEVFIKIHRGIDKLEDQFKLQAWVYQITRNTIIDYYRKGDDDVEVTSEPPDVLAEENGNEEIESEVATWLRPMMEELPEKYREALQLTEMQGLTQKELAERLNISISGAKSRVQRAREKLKDVLLECCHVEIDRRGKVVDWESKEPDCRYCTVPLSRNKS